MALITETRLSGVELSDVNSIPFTIEPDPPPLWIDERGAVRVGDSRVLLEIVVTAYEQGEPPKEIVDSFPTLTLADVYGVISYYLRHKEVVQEYLHQRQIQALEIRARIEAFQNSPEFQARLAAQRTN